MPSQSWPRLGRTKGDSKKSTSYSAFDSSASLDMEDDPEAIDARKVKATLEQLKDDSLPPSLQKSFSLRSLLLGGSAPGPEPEEKRAMAKTLSLQELRLIAQIQTEEQAEFSPGGKKFVSAFDRVKYFFGVLGVIALFVCLLAFVPMPWSYFLSSGAQPSDARLTWHVAVRGSTWLTVPVQRGKVIDILMYEKIS
ncbi:hypothetical protein CYMTET_35960 [Cymbomonas tetramitiformis]|uniref:Uncharacterized protein n=1 Tax=Cymbomonas tetramitiformis TaxID=36881 RepID=A0AAE0KMZ4_9CHLO|nr:hypothetical protein CYMTET_35960 [Cymbomonas tetramitiformis]